MWYKKNQSQLLLMIIVLFWFAQYVHVPYQTIYLNMIQVSSNLIGIIIGAYGIAQLALRIPVGVVADLNGNHKRFIMVGMLSTGSAALFRMLLPSGVGFLIANILSGVASAMWISFMVLYTNLFSKDKLQMATSKVIFANNLGILIAFVTSTLLYNHIGMKFICFLGAIAGGTGFVLAFLLDKPMEKIEMPSISSLLSAGKNKKLILFAMLALIVQGVQMSTTMSFTTQIVRDIGASSYVVGLATIIYMVSSVCFAKIGGNPKFLKKFPKQYSIPAMYFLIFVYCMVIPNTTSLILICLFQLLPGMSMGILFAALTAEAISEISIEKKSTAMGFYQAIYAIGMTLFPIISGFFQENYSMNVAFLFLGFACIIGMVSAIGFYFKVNTKYYKQMEKSN